MLLSTMQRLWETQTRKTSVSRIGFSSEMDEIVVRTSGRHEDEEPRAPGGRRRGSRRCPRRCSCQRGTRRAGHEASLDSSFETVASPRSVREGGCGLFARLQRSEAGKMSTVKSSSSQVAAGRCARTWPVEFVRQLCERLRDDVGVVAVQCSRC